MMSTSAAVVALACTATVLAGGGELGGGPVPDPDGEGDTLVGVVVAIALDVCGAVPDVADNVDAMGVVVFCAWATRCAIGKVIKHRHKKEIVAAASRRGGVMLLFEPKIDINPQNH